jgi:hypothetical protein
VRLISCVDDVEDASHPSLLVHELYEMPITAVDSTHLYYSSPTLCFHIDRIDIGVMQVMPCMQTILSLRGESMVWQS